MPRREVCLYAAEKRRYGSPEGHLWNEAAAAPSRFLAPPGKFGYSPYARPAYYVNPLSPVYVASVQYPVAGYPSSVGCSQWTYNPWNYNVAYAWGY
jgi:hypothetical protein